ncbi:MAG: 30S ribosomal protein S7 [Chloroflexota bacterium]
MSRRSRAVVRKIIPDAKYNSPIVSQLVNRLMGAGKKSKAEMIVYHALDTLAKQDNAKPAITMLEEAVRNVTPQLEVKPRRVGGATYQVPVEVRSERGLALALRWLIASSKARGGKSMAEKLAAELGDAAKGQGTTIKKRDDTHKMAEANRAFVHFRW